MSLDGYIEDAHGSFEWTEPSDEVFTFITDLVRPVGTYLYGRRLYETKGTSEPPSNPGRFNHAQRRTSEGPASRTLTPKRAVGRSSVSR